MRLRVAVDARTIYDQPLRGIGKVAIELVRHLAVARPGWRFELYHAEPATRREPDREEPLFAQVPNIRPRRVSGPGDRWQAWPRWYFPWAVARSRADVLWAPAGLLPAWAFCPQVATVYDLIPWETGRTDPPARQWIRQIRRTLNVARAVVVASQFTRGRLLDFAADDIPDLEPRLHVIPLAPISRPPAFIATSRREELIQNYRLRGADHAIVLHLGMGDPRKGTRQLLQAWSRLSAAIRGQTDLLIVGLSDAERADFKAWMENQEFFENRDLGGVHLCGYADERDLRDLLGLATVLAYPTQFEGFGLPILDGFAAGVPVLTGQTSSLPEVAAGAAYLVDVRDPAAIAKGLTELLQSPSLRQQLIAHGRNRFGEFAWERTAESMAQVLASSVTGGTRATP